MAEAGSGQKTEKASPQKLRKAREQGQVARSRDVATAIGIVLTLRLLVWLLPHYLADFRQLFALALADLGGDGGLDNRWSMLFGDSMLLLFKLLLPLALIPLAIVIGSLLPGGWVFSSANLRPRFDKLSPAANLGRLLSAQHWTEVAKSLAKALLLGGLLYWVCASRLADFMALSALPFGPALHAGCGLLLDSVMQLAMIFVLFAFIDVPLQALLFLRGQRMSKQEIKEELKSSEGRPEVRNRIRQLQRALAQRSVRKAVPGADVVLVNPSHYSVALKYDEKRAEAPFVVAKGLDEMALFIRQVADEQGVEIVALPPLARAIYHSSQVNQQIPAPLYSAVAQVLSYVLQIKAFRSGRRRQAPTLPERLAIPSAFDPSPQS